MPSQFRDLVFEGGGVKGVALSSAIEILEHKKIMSDIEEMCREGVSRAVHVGVQIDTAGEHEGSVRYEVSEPDWTGKAHRIAIERLPESDEDGSHSLTPTSPDMVLKNPSSVGDERELPLDSPNSKL